MGVRARPAREGTHSLDLRRALAFACAAQGHSAGMSHHPAAEIVAIALRKVLKLASGRKYQALQEECNAFLENIDTIIPPLPPARGSNAQLQIPLTPPAQAPPEATTQAAQPAADPTPTADATPAAPAAAQADSAAADAAADAPAASGDAAPSIQEAAVDTAEAPRAQDGPSELSPSPPPNDAPRQPASPLPPMAVRTEMALPDGVALRIIAILRSVIGSERPPAMEAALDCIQKLIAFKFLQGAVHMINVSKKGVKDVLDTGALILMQGSALCPTSMQQPSRRANISYIMCSVSTTCSGRHSSRHAVVTISC